MEKEKESEVISLLNKIIQELQNSLYHIKKSAEVSVNKTSRERFYARASGVHQSLVVIQKYRSSFEDSHQ